MAKAPAQTPIKLVYRPHNSSDAMRVWQSTWVGDQFEVFSRLDFSDLQGFCRRLSIVCEEAEDYND